MRLILFLALTAPFIACGGGNAQTAPSTAGTASASASAAPTEAAPKAFSMTTMSKEEQAAYMKANVVPQMRPVFQAHDAKDYATFSCKTCHGPAYKNPHEFLPHLTMQNGKLTAFADKPEMSKFMSEKVLPAMITAMGAKPFDMQTHEGFGCNGCHTIDMK
jgi:hypothetical protein